MAENLLLKRPHWRNSPEEYDRRWLARVKARCTVTERGCWEWAGFIDPDNGYPTTAYRGRTNTVHRHVYMVVHSVELAREQYVCHSCDVRHCCNPDHLWLGSNSENQKDSSRKVRHYESRRTECERGHPFTPENTRLTPSKSGGYSRTCKACERLRMSSPAYRAKQNVRQREYRARRRALRERARA